MAKYNKRPNFKVTINYPMPENQEKFDRRAARAVAKILVETLPLETIDEIIEGLKVHPIK